MAIIRCSGIARFRKGRVTGRSTPQVTEGLDGVALGVVSLLPAQVVRPVRLGQGLKVILVRADNGGAKFDSENKPVAVWVVGGSGGRKAWAVKCRMLERGPVLFGRKAQIRPLIPPCGDGCVQGKEIIARIGRRRCQDAAGELSLLLRLDDVARCQLLGLFWLSA